MGPVYIAALIVGLGITGGQVLLSGGEADAGGHGDADADADVHAAAGGPGADLAPHDVEHDHGHTIGGLGLLAVMLSVRFWTFGLLGFGLLGTLAHYLRLASPGLTVVLSVVMGLVCGAVASVAFRAVVGTSVGSGGEARDLLGAVGTVMVPLRKGQRGKIRVEVRGRTLDYLATSDAELLDAGDRVLVEEVDGSEVRVGRVPPELME